MQKTIMREDLAKTAYPVQILDDRAFITGGRTAGYDMRKALGMGIGFDTTNESYAMTTVAENRKEV